MWANRPLKPARSSTARQRRERPRPTPPSSRLAGVASLSTASGRRLADMIRLLVRHSTRSSPTWQGRSQTRDRLLKARLAIRSTGASRVVCDSRSRRGVERGPPHIGLTALVEDAVSSFSALMIRSAICWWSARSRAFALRAPPRCRPLHPRARHPIRLARPATAPPMGRPVRNSSPIRLVELLPFLHPNRGLHRLHLRVTSFTLRHGLGPHRLRRAPEHGSRTGRRRGARPMSTTVAGSRGCTSSDWGGPASSPHGSSATCAASAAYRLSLVAQRSRIRNQVQRYSTVAASASCRAVRYLRRQRSARPRRFGQQARPGGHPRVAERTCPPHGRPARRCVT